MADSCCRLVSIRTVRVQEVALGEEHVHVFGAGILEELVGGLDRGLERLQLLLLDLDAPAVVLHHGQRG